MIKNKIVIYTALFKDYDCLKDYENYSNLFDFVCFSDKLVASKNWKTILIKENINPELLNRKIKILGHNYLKNYDISLYIDANVKILKNPIYLIKKNLNFSDIIISKHFLRQCVYQEAFALLRSSRFDNFKILRQIKKYLKLKMPSNLGLTENSIIIRKHNKPSVRKIMKDWWRELILGSHRDQLSLPFVLWRNNYKIFSMNENKRKKNYFSFKDHKLKKKKNLLKIINSLVYCIMYFFLLLIYK
jgi:hypothetical protein